MRKKRRQRHRQSIVLPMSLFLIFAAVFFSALWVLKTSVEPELEELGRMRAKLLVTQIVNQTLNEQFRQQLDAGELIVRKTNEEGKTEIIQADTGKINLLVTEISKGLQKRYREAKDDIIRVPAGTLLGSKIFSQTGPKVKMKVIPLSVSGMDFKTEFEAKGINQTKYKVYLVLSSQVKVMAPFSSSTFDMSSTVLIAEAVILGDVPTSYVQVPKEDILDVTDQ